MFLCELYLILGIYNMDIIIVKKKWRIMVDENMGKTVKTLSGKEEEKEGLG